MVMYYGEQFITNRWATDDVGNLIFLGLPIFIVLYKEQFSESIYSEQMVELKLVYPRV